MEISFLFKSFVTLFTIIDPVGGAPFFLGITADYTERERQKIAFKACVTAFVTLILFLWLGRYILSIFHISLSSFKIAGGILLFIIALEMLFGKTTQVKTSEKETIQIKEKEDPSVVPLGIPYLAGPGAITTTIILGQIPGFLDKVFLSITIFFVILTSYVILKKASKIFRFLGELGTKAVVRILGLILASIAVEYVIEGIKETLKI